MAEIPRAVLSERFQHLMKGHQVRSAVFLTFRLEPGFFEQEVLPAILDLPLSNAPAVRLVQLEDHLRSEVDHIAVYYDRAGLVVGSESAKLDVRRIPITWPTGYFHPKNVLLLTEAIEADESGYRERRLLVAAMSANLTRAGWWENVEVCHIEVIHETEVSSLRGDLLELIRRVRGAAHTEVKHEALDDIRDFVRGLEQRKHASAGGILHPRLYVGRSSVPDFLDDTLGGTADGLCLEVVSPYFDVEDAAPLRELVERFAPREVRVFLPRKDDGSALCSEALFDAVREMPDVSWARLPADLLRRGKAEKASPRRVHAKVYRFFDPRRCYEALFVGSVNLTRAAHSAGGNFETGFLVETSPPRIPDWWLIAEGKKTVVCAGAETEDEEVATTRLSIRYDWGKEGAEAFWDGADRSPPLRVAAQGHRLFDLATVPSREWKKLPEDHAKAIAELLPSTSFLTVTEDGGAPATILVQEEGMAHKPSILLSLTVAEILRYWSLLTPEQREAFIAGRITADGLLLGGDDVVVRTILGRVDESIFDTFAGIYHAFGSFSAALRHALEEEREKEAEYRLFGRKYDSLRNLLDRSLQEVGPKVRAASVDPPPPPPDPVTRWLTVLSAKQIVRQVRKEWPEFVRGHRKEMRDLERLITQAERVKHEFTFGDRKEREAFVEWYEEWFLAPAKPVVATT